MSESEELMKLLGYFISEFSEHLPKLIIACKSKKERYELEKAFREVKNVYYETIDLPNIYPEYSSIVTHLRESLKGIRENIRRSLQPIDIPVIISNLTAIVKAFGIGRSHAINPALEEKATRSWGESGEFSVGEPEIPKPAPHPPSELAQKARSGKRVVNTSFASQTSPDDDIDREIPLKNNESYYFLFWIGELKDKSMEKTPTELPSVPEKTRLTIAVFGFQDGLLITPGADVGELEVQGDGTAQVITQPLSNFPPKSKHLKERLFFPIRCPDKEGIYRMRCNIYCGQVLLQSREIRAQVSGNPKRLANGEWALQSILDYSLVHRLDPHHLSAMTEHRLSIMLNSNDDGTNSIHIYSSKGASIFKKDDIRFEENRLRDFIQLARGCLKIASWGKEVEWREDLSLKFKYRDGQKNLSRLSTDLINMAKWGREFYVHFKMGTKFEQVLLEPAFIQIAMKDSSSHVIPSAMIYDYPLDVGAEDVTLCDSFSAALANGASLESHECFKGNCPSRDDEKKVCPSGFWGFRHYLGMPVSLEKKRDDKDAESINGSDVPNQILFTDKVRFVAAVATDLVLLSKHMEKLERMKTNLSWQYSYLRNDVFRYLKSSPHLVYFYCHGALLRDQLSYLQVGDHDKIFPSNFDQIRWTEPQPLVFLNGCHTVDPIGALNFIDPLIKLSKCAGVIGTEITIYEEMATVFAEEFFRQFLDKEAVGIAIRNARLRLLEEGNPLGLVYVPYVVAGLKLVQS